MHHKEESDLGNSESQPPSTPTNYAGAYASHWARHALQDHINDITEEVSAPSA